MHIVYIHGNGQTAESFNFIRSQITRFPEIVLEYDSTNGFYNNFQDMLVRLDGVRDIFFIAHSLGGIYALHLANAIPDRVLGAVTMSTPYGGSEAAEIVKYILPFNQLIRDIQPKSAPIMDAKKFTIRHPWINMVSLKGQSPLMVTPNDGVVTFDSMRQRQDIRLIDVESNHYEITQSLYAVEIIRQALADVENGVAPVVSAYA
ncbi:alpha/beta hydrolase [Noviherbaspirillum cavernae]|uniref:Alpha/beta hydrolase n=1 Tax=Noviherbaspirillum cavernae TaxID=2320862 RepID=A0A418WVZ6_9BURK|nr:alpha/beta hydrolase [Noviherbaspirillum cavernae]RJF96827.1 alpha/beta hydrolase [Noviherbaspirillum cavernae]